VALYSTLYVWTEVRPAAYLEQPVSSLHDLRNVVTGSEFGGSMFAFSPADIVRDRLPLMWDELWHQFGWLTAVLVLGAVVLARRDRAVAGFLALIVAVDLFVIANYSIFDIFIYFLPAWIACAIALGIGFDAILQRISAPVAAASVAVIALLLPVWPAADNWSEQNLSHGIPEAEPVRALLNATPDHSLILARVSDYNVAELMWYFLFGEGLTAAHDLTLYFDYDAGEVCRYLRNGVPPDTTWRRHVYRDGHATPLDERPPAGLHVIVLGDLHPELAARGFTAAPLGPGVLELQPPATCPES
jgi:hypothetical protein